MRRTGSKWLIAAFIVTTSAVLAQDPTPSSADTNAATQPVVKRIDGQAPSMQGMVVVRDAETGELRAPNAEEWATLAPSLDPLQRSSEGLVETHYPDGTVGVALDGRFQSMTVVRKGNEGATDSVCSHAPQTIVDTLSGQIDTVSTEGVSDEY